MDTWKITALLMGGVALAIITLLLRVRSDGKYEIKTVDLALLIIPLLLFALGTGKLTGLDLFGVKADLYALWTAAAQTDIKKQIAPSATASVQDIVNVMEMATKGGPSELQRLLERRLQALEFMLGYGVTTARRSAPTSMRSPAAVNCAPSSSTIPTAACSAFSSPLI